MRKSLLLSTSLAAALATPAYAESWYLVGEGDEDLFFADADSVSRNGSYLQVNIIDSMLDSFVSNGSNVYYLRGPVNLDCSSRQYQNVSRAGYTLGKAYAGEVSVDTSWQAVNSGTHAEAIYDFACSGTYRNSPISDPFGYAEDYWYYYYDY